MWTLNYKGLYINGYSDRTECGVVWAHGGEVLPGHKFKTLLGAKRFITLVLKYQ
jgi:hypothetical protein